MKIELDDFAIWQVNPVTQAFFKALRKMADESKTTWLAKSWDNGLCDERELIDLRATSRVALDICELTLEDLEANLATGEA